MVTEVSLFQVAKVPTNMYDYTLPFKTTFVLNSYNPFISRLF